MYYLQNRKESKLGMVAILSSSGTNSFMSRLVLTIFSKKGRCISFRIICMKRKGTKGRENIVRDEIVADTTWNFHCHKTTQNKLKRTTINRRKKLHTFNSNILLDTVNSFSKDPSIKRTPYAWSPCLSLLSLSLTLCETDITLLDGHLLSVPILSACELTAVVEIECIFFFLLPLQDRLSNDKLLKTVL